MISKQQKTAHLSHIEGRRH